MFVRLFFTIDDEKNTDRDVVQHPPARASPMLQIFTGDDENNSTLDWRDVVQQAGG